MQNRKIVFMGTPDYAAGALKCLIEAGYDILLAVTQPDRPKGRSGALQFSPVKEVALANGIPVFQPERIKKPEAVEELKKYEVDYFVVVAYGQILSQEILDMPRECCLNIHASLLPKYRGASPIQNVILHGEEKTGVTIQKMDIGVDTGDILYQKELILDKEETFETLHDRLMVLGGQAIVEALEALYTVGLTGTKQNDEESCYAPLIAKEEGRIDFTRSAKEIDCQVRGMNPWPSAFTSFRGKQLKIWKVSVADDSIQENSADSSGTNTRKPGEIISVEKKYFEVATGDGILRVFELQLEGKKRMDTGSFLLGVKVECGEMLGE